MVQIGEGILVARSCQRKNRGAGDPGMDRSGREAEIYTGDQGKVCLEGFIGKGPSLGYDTNEEISVELREKAGCEWPEELGTWERYQDEWKLVPRHWKHSPSSSWTVVPCRHTNPL